MHKSKHHHNNSVSDKRPRLEYSSKHVKGKHKHSRRKTELVGMVKASSEIEGQDPNKAKTDVFGSRTFHRRGVRRHNFNIERTLDFIGIGSSNQQNNPQNDAANSGFAELFRTINNNPNNQNSNFISAAEAMGSGLQRSNSIFAMPFSQSFHNRHNSVTVAKNQSRRFETEIQNKVEELEENKLPMGNTFDMSNRGNNQLFFNTFDNPNSVKNRRRNSMAFNMNGNTFHFRRTISKIPSFIDRKKMGKQLSIKENVEFIRRQSSLGNITT
jgi:hypothetical protein